MLYANLVSTKLRGNWFCFHNHNLQVASFPGFAIGDTDKLSGYRGSEFTQTCTHLYKYDRLRQIFTLVSIQIKMKVSMLSI